MVKDTLPISLPHTVITVTEGAVLRAEGASRREGRGGGSHPDCTSAVDCVFPGVKQWKQHTCLVLGRLMLKCISKTWEILQSPFLRRPFLEDEAGQQARTGGQIASGRPQRCVGRALVCSQVCVGLARALPPFRELWSVARPLSLSGFKYS